MQCVILDEEKNTIKYWYIWKKIEYVIKLDNTIVKLSEFDKQLLLCTRMSFYLKILIHAEAFRSE